MFKHYGISNKSTFEYEDTGKINVRINERFFDDSFVSEVRSRSKAIPSLSEGSVLAVLYPDRTTTSLGRTIWSLFLLAASFFTTFFFFFSYEDHLVLEFDVSLCQSWRDFGGIPYALSVYLSSV